MELHQDWESDLWFPIDCYHYSCQFQIWLTWRTQSGMTSLLSWICVFVILYVMYSEWLHTPSWPSKVQNLLYNLNLLVTLAKSADADPLNQLGGRVIMQGARWQCGHASRTGGSELLYPLGPTTQMLRSQVAQDYHLFAVTFLILLRWWWWWSTYSCSRASTYNTTLL